MGMSIAHGSPQCIWVPVKPAVTLYCGGLVGIDISAPSEGVEMLPAAAGVANKTNNDIPFGLIIGTNRKNPLFDTTYKCEYITSPAAADAHDGASIEYFGVEGPYSKGDPVPMVKVAILDPCSVIRAPLYSGAIGTAPTLLTATAGDTDGLGVTTNTMQFTSTADNDGTIYCRTGANAGAYRALDSASATVHTWDVAMRSDTAIGDTFVGVPMRTHGSSTVLIGATCNGYIDCSKNPTKAGTDLWSVTVIRLDLRDAGKENVEFRFNANHFANFITPAVGA